MYDPYQQYESGNQQYYPSVPQQFAPQVPPSYNCDQYSQVPPSYNCDQYTQPQATPSFNCDMNTYAYQPTNAASFDDQYCPSYYSSKTYNGCSNSMQSYSAVGSNSYPTDSGYYNYNSYNPNHSNTYGFCEAEPVTSSSTSYLNRGPCNSDYSKLVPVQNQYGASTSRQSSTTSKQRLPSPDSFIKECLSGRKSNERLKKEEIIENSIQKTVSKETEFCRNGESSQKNSNYCFVGVKKTDLKSQQRVSGSKDSHQRRKNLEFIKRWR